MTIIRYLKKLRHQEMKRTNREIDNSYEYARLFYNATMKAIEYNFDIEKYKDDDIVATDFEVNKVLVSVIIRFKISEAIKEKYRYKVMAYLVEAFNYYFKSISRKERDVELRIDDQDVKLTIHMNRKVKRMFNL